MRQTETSGAVEAGARVRIVRSRRSARSARAVRGTSAPGVLPAARTPV